MFALELHVLLFTIIITNKRGKFHRLLSSPRKWSTVAVIFEILCVRHKISWLGYLRGNSHAAKMATVGNPAAWIDRPWN